MIVQIRIKKVLWISMLALCILTGLYPITYLATDREFGLLGLKSDALLSNLFYNVGFYTHILGGGLALLIGWIQFSSQLRARNLALHRTIGKIYFIASLLSSIAGISIGFFATGGLIPATGFITLGVIWLASTSMGYAVIRQHNIAQHQKWMIFSYACCFAGVTLRVYQPLLIMYFGNFLSAYKIVAWLCWVPNVLVAFYIARKYKMDK